MFRFALLLLVLTIPTVCFWLDRKRLLRGHALLVTAALLLSLVLVPLLLFLAFSVLAWLGPLQERKLPEPVGLGSSIRCA